MRKKIIGIVVLFLMSCAHQQGAKTGASSGQVNAQAVSGINDTGVEPHSSAADKEVVNDQLGQLSKFSLEDQAKNGQPVGELEIIPTEVNSQVDKWINYFQNKGRPHMERYLARSTRYEAVMKKVLRDNKLPEDLFYIALIESGFASSALSHASAVGYWQFIRGTGKRYKLQINQMIDERRDPILSTQAAADYFRQLYQMFDSWYLAMAAYNVGEARVERAVRKYKTRDFWELSRHRRALPAETDNYIPKFIAAKLIAKNPDKYGFEGIDYLSPIEFDHITVDQPVNLRVMADKMNYNYEDFKALNPKYKGEIAPLDSDNKLGLRIPIGQFDVAKVAASGSYADKVEFVADQDEVQLYKIRRGDTFSKIARKFRTSIAYLRDINDFPRKKRLRVGKKIYVPDRTPLVQKQPEVMAKVKPRKSGSYYIVQPGDTLFSIAAKYQTTISELKRLNSLSRKSKLRSGIKIIVPKSAKEDTAKQDQSTSAKKYKNKKYAKKNSRKKYAVKNRTRKIASKKSSKKKSYAHRKKKKNEQIASR